MSDWRRAYCQTLSLLVDLLVRSINEDVDIKPVVDVATRLFPMLADDLNSFFHNIAAFRDVELVEAVINARGTRMTQPLFGDLLLLFYAGNLFECDDAPMVMPRDAAKFGVGMAYIATTLVRRLAAMGHVGLFSAEQALALALTMMARHQNRRTVECRPRAIQVVVERPPAGTSAA